MDLNILIVSAHPDDLETGMGGTAQLLARAGHHIVSVVTHLPKDEVLAEKRRQESLAAHTVLGLQPPRFFGQEESNPLFNNDAREAFARLASEIRPDVVFTHWPVDVNPDHKATAAFSMDPFLQRGVNTELFCYEVFSELGRPQSLGFYPTHYTDISQRTVFDIKRMSVEFHKSQGIKKLWEGNLGMQKVRGKEIDLPQAEAFVRLTRYGSLNEELQKILLPTLYKLPNGMGVHVFTGK